MSYYYNKDWTRVYKVTFNVADTFFHKVHIRDSNNDFIVRNAELMFEQRKKACQEINEMFGLNITVVNKNAPKELPKEEDING